MASTRNKNTPNDYCLQQRSYTDSSKYTDYTYSQVGRAYMNAMPCVGIMPSHMPREAFSKNRSTTFSYPQIIIISFL